MLEGGEFSWRTFVGPDMPAVSHLELSYDNLTIIMPKKKQSLILALLWNVEVHKSFHLFAEKFELAQSQALVMFLEN